MWRELGDRQNTANVLAAMAGLARDQGDYSVARARLTERLEILRDVEERRGIAFILEGFVGLAAAEGHAERAICLASEAARLREIIGAAAPPAWRGERDRALQTANAALGSDAVERASAPGRELSPQESIALALGQPGRSGEACRHEP